MSDPIELPSHVDRRVIEESAAEAARARRPVLVTVTPGDATRYDLLITPAHSVDHITLDGRCTQPVRDEEMYVVFMNEAVAAVWSANYRGVDVAAKLTKRPHTLAVLTVFFDAYRTIAAAA